MTADPWGVTSGYNDASDHWHATSSATRHALLKAMGVDPAAPPHPLEAAFQIVYQNESTDLNGPGVVRLEDGGTIVIDRRLPPDVPLGYHEFDRKGSSRPTQLVVAPRQCLPPPDRAWGWAAQLYALRSRQSWGFGDLADLERLADWSSQQGARCLLINPLCAAAPVATQQASPYSPTSRRFRNPLYLRIERMAGAPEMVADLGLLVSSGRALNNNARIDRPEVFRLKQRACELLWERFQGDPRFDAFSRQQGTSLEQFALYCALAEQHGCDWRSWPAQYRRPELALARIDIDGLRRRVAYHQWLQWQLDLQLAAASKPLAIIHDLPIGFDAGGADAWAWQDTLAGGVSVGAPPDLYNAAGQDWGLPPLVPHKLRASGYVPWIETVRASLRHAGGLRMDHVMGLFRLFWIAHDDSPQQGAYVEYRADEMLAILALESHRAGAFVVGEDLGTVEPGTRSALASTGVLSCRVLWFENDPPEQYPHLALVSASTHDLPTIAGAWTSSDYRAQQQIGLDPSAEGAAHLRAQLAETARVRDNAPVVEVIDRTYAALAKAPSAIVTAML
ncbi:MAG TPA: 4-alpha-glucanotransferase, partial [Pirellulales bacterium]|nr:4-alpha-glucanotransferase [Pirellulales bacterium]